MGAPGVLAFWWLGLFLAPAGAAQNPGSEQWITEHFQKAREAQQANLLETAAGEYRLILSAAKLPEVFVNLGLVYHLQRKYSEAIASFRAGLALKPDMLNAHVLLGIDLYKTQDYQAAIDPLQRALDALPGERQAGLYLGLAYLALDMPDSAVRQLRKTSAHFPKDIEIQYHLGNAYSDAMRQSSQVLLDGDRNAAVFHWALAISAQRKNDLAKVVDEYLRALAVDPEIAPLYAELSQHFRRLGLLDLAAAAESRFAALNGIPLGAAESPGQMEDAAATRISVVELRQLFEAKWNALPPVESGQARPRIADAAVNQRLQDLLQHQKTSALREAVGLLLRRDAATAAKRFTALPATKGEWVVPYLAALAHFMGGNPEMAEDILETRLTKFFRIPSVALLRLRIQTDLAFRCFDAVTTSQPDSVRARLLLAKFHAANFQADEALAEYQSILKQDPTLAGVHLALGQVHEDRQEWHLAAEQYRAELELSPGNALTMALLGHAYVKGGEVDMAIPVLEKIVAAHPEDAKALADLGTAWTAKGDDAKAIAALERSLQHDPGEYQLHYRLFNLYKRTGDMALAQRHLETFQKAQAKNKEATPAISK